jgi:hypothetical protein
VISIACAASLPIAGNIRAENSSGTLLAPLALPQREPAVRPSVPAWRAAESRLGVGVAFISADVTVVLLLIIVGALIIFGMYNANASQQVLALVAVHVSLRAVVRLLYAQRRYFPS